MIGLSIWYLTRREPLVIHGEVRSRTFDLAARVDGRIVVTRSQDVKQGVPPGRTNSCLRRLHRHASFVVLTFGQRRAV